MNCADQPRVVFSVAAPLHTTTILNGFQRVGHTTRRYIMDHTAALLRFVCDKMCSQLHQWLSDVLFSLGQDTSVQSWQHTKTQSKHFNFHARYFHHAVNATV